LGYTISCLLSPRRGAGIGPQPADDLGNAGLQTSLLIPAEKSLLGEGAKEGICTGSLIIARLTKCSRIAGKEAERARHLRPLSYDAHLQDFHHVLGTTT
jgi:hypothetical protein